MTKKPSVSLSQNGVRLENSFLLPASALVHYLGEDTARSSTEHEDSELRNKIERGKGSSLRKEQIKRGH